MELLQRVGRWKPISALRYMWEAERSAYRRRDLGELVRARQSFHRWYESQRAGATPLADEQAWMTFGAIDFLDAWLRPHHRVFEWGCGGSSVFFARRVERGWSVEHDAAWCDTARAALLERGLAHKWTVELAEPEPESAAGVVDPADPDGYGTSEPPHTRRFARYASAIDAHEDGSFDAVVVDGRSRPSCAKHALSKVARGGCLVLDNSERPHYRRVHAMLEERKWECRPFPGPGPYGRSFWETTVWLRP